MQVTIHFIFREDSVDDVIKSLEDNSINLRKCFLENQTEANNKISSYH